MDAFLVAFWPNLAATVAGVVLGLPIALWVSRLSLRGSERSSQRSQAQRVHHALQVLISAMKSNCATLREYSEVLASAHLRWHLGLDVSAWGAIQADFIAEITDPALRREVAFHFSQLKTLTFLNQQYLQFNFGTNPSMSEANATRTTIGNDLKNICGECALQAERLVAAALAAQQPLAQHSKPNA